MEQHFIEFPGLGWRLPISPDIFTIPIGGGITVKWYGVLIALGFLLAMIYGLKRAKPFGIDPDRMIDVVLVSAIFAFIGARLYYVLFSDERAQYFADPLSIFAVWEGGLGIYGGVIFAFLTALWMCRVRKVDTLRMFDLASIGFLIGQGIGRWGNFFNQEAFGELVTNPDLQFFPYAVYIERLGEWHMATFFYESVACFLIFIFLLIYRRKAKNAPAGNLFLWYWVLYGIERAYVEGLRTDSLYLFSTGIRVSQLVAAVSFIAAAGAIAFVLLKKKPKPENLFANRIHESPDTQDEKPDEM